jgi:hypothetical protein
MMLDHFVGELVEMLDDKGMLDNTYIFFRHVLLEMCEPVFSSFPSVVTVQTTVGARTVGAGTDPCVERRALYMTVRISAHEALRIMFASYISGVHRRCESGCVGMEPLASRKRPRVSIPIFNPSY